MEDLPKWAQDLIPLLTTYGIKLLGALALWIIGGWLIKAALNAFERASSERLDGTVRRYLSSSLGVLLRVALIVAILGYFGVETTTFAALLAGAGLAIGTAWGGLLQNFAAGVFLMVLRPFTSDDFVTAGGVTGTVVEVGLFATTINTPDNVRTVVGNAKIFGDTIQNFSTNGFRRVDLKAQLDHTTDVLDAMKRLREKVAKIPNIEADQGVDVEILEFNLAGPVLAVRPYVHNDHYWDVYFATNRAIVEVGGEAGYEVPKQHLNVAQ